MRRFYLNFLRDEKGATAIEYALLASMICVFIILSLNQLGSSLSSEFSEVANDLK